MESVISKIAPPRFREATFEDYEQVSALESRYGLQAKSYEEWTHLWLHNPVYLGLPEWPIGWVCENEDNEIVGCIANIPLGYEFGKRTLVAATSRAFVVDSHYRCYAFLLLSHFFAQKNVDLFVNTTVNAKASVLQGLFRASRVPSGTWNRSAFWITDYRAFAASLLSRKEMPSGKTASYPLSAGLFLRDMLASSALRNRRNGTEVEFCSQFDARFEGFWQRARRNSPGLLLATRSQEVLNWHFKHALAKNKAWIATISQGGELVAYAVFSRQDNPSYQLKRMRLVDFQTCTGQTELLRPLLLSAVERCQHEDVHMLEAMGFGSEKKRVIDSMAPHCRELGSWRYFYKTNDQELAGSLRDPGVWDTTCFDGDASL
ncbi:MAG: hypothetical protein WB711_21285 [Terriglobales bacterium]